MHRAVIFDPRNDEGVIRLTWRPRTGATLCMRRRLAVDAAGLACPLAKVADRLAASAVCSGCSGCSGFIGRVTQNVHTFFFYPPRGMYGVSV
jgi:hypothetical protein